MKKAIIMIPVLALLTTVTILQQQNAHATPIITNFGNGYADGKHAAQYTFHSGGYRDAAQYLSGTTYRIAQDVI